MVEAHAWNEGLDLSHEAMDHEHHLQIALVTGFADAIEQRRPWLARRLLDQLLTYSTAHFGGEELLMEAANYAERAAHTGEHVEFVAHIRQIQRALEEGDEDVALEAALDLRQALAAHMTDADRKLVQATRAARPPARDAHAAEHGALLARMRELEAAHDGEDGDGALAAALELRAALAAHVDRADRGLAEFVRGGP